MKLIIYILFIAIIFSGCTMKYSFTGASIPPEAKTVSIQQFPNMAPLNNALLSQLISESLKERFISETNLQLVAIDGDLDFTGTIVRYFTKPMAIQAGTDQAQQNRLTITVKVAFTNRIDTKADYEATFSRFADYDSSQDLDEVENSLVSAIVTELVDDMFNKAVVNW